MINKQTLLILTSLSLSACSSISDYMPDNALMGNHITSFGNTGTVTAYSAAINRDITERVRKLPVTTFEHGSSTHIQAHIRNLTTDGRLNEDFYNLVDAIYEVSRGHSDIALNVRYSLSGDMKNELESTVHHAMYNQINQLHMTDIRYQDKLNIKQPFNSDPSYITFVLYPTMLPEVSN